jgi:hypothetical protein
MAGHALGHIRAMTHRRSALGALLSLLPVVWLLSATASAATLAFTVTTSEPVVVTGTPRIAIDVGGLMRYATYASGSGTAALSFAYAVQPGDFDANGIALVSPIDLDGGTIADLVGTPPGALTFTLPDTSTIKIQTYTAAFATSPITNANANVVSFTIAKAPTNASFSFTITSSGGSGSVTGSGTIGGLSHTVSAVDVSALPSGTLTLLVTVSTAAGGTGAARMATATPTFTGALDSLPASAASFSIRRLSSAYAGPLLRVRRSSDNAQQDVPATVAGNLDASSLASFCGASSCFVSALYDQSGNSRDAVQATAGNQPRIVDTGSTEVEGGRPALRFAAAGPYLAAPAIPGQSVQGTFNVVTRVTDTTVNRHVIGDRLSIGAGGRVIRAASNAIYTGFNVGGAVVTLSGSSVPQRILSIFSDASGMTGTVDGALRLGGTSSVYQVSGVPFWIGGGGPGQSVVGDWIGTVSEATVFNITLTTAQRQTLERNQGAYFGIAVP